MSEIKYTKSIRPKARPSNRRLKPISVTNEQKDAELNRVRAMGYTCFELAENWPGFTIEEEKPIVYEQLKIIPREMRGE